MLDLYVLYACVHFAAGKAAPRAGQTQCVERQVFFHPQPCVRELPKPGRLLEHSRSSRSWVECREMRADSWIPADSKAGAGRSYQAVAAASDGKALAALLAPLSPQARATIAPGELKGQFQRAFQGPGNWSFFVVGNGSTVLAFAVAGLDGFQFAEMATDVSSSSAAMPSAGLDLKGIAQDAGVELSYHTEISRRAMPPPGGLQTLPLPGGGGGQRQ